MLLTESDTNLTIGIIEYLLQFDRSNVFTQEYYYSEVIMSLFYVDKNAQDNGCYYCSYSSYTSESK